VLTFETEANGESWSSYERGPSLAGSRETRGGWPLLTVKTRQMGTLGVHVKGVLSWLVPERPERGGPC
jgi:hypothetical protein